MKQSSEIFDLLKEKFGEAVIGHDDLYIRVDALSIKNISEYLKTENELEFDSLMNLSGVDESGLKDSNSGFSLYYHLHSIKLKHKITLKVIMPRANPEVESVESIWKCAGWHEREAFDLLGIKFLHHTDLRRILLPDDWEGFPLRKDYKTPEIYNGMKVTG